MPEPENEQSIPEQITQLDNLQRQIDKLEICFLIQFYLNLNLQKNLLLNKSQVKKLEKEIKKLDDIEKNFMI